LSTVANLKEFAAAKGDTTFFSPQPIHIASPRISPLLFWLVCLSR